MNNKDQGRLTPKQQELVKRLEQIRQNKKTIQESLSKDTAQQRAKDIKRRNEDAQQRSRNKKQKEKEFVRPIVEKRRPTIATKTIAPRMRREEQPKKVVKKKTNQKNDPGSLIGKLSHGKSLAQAIVLSEILDQPVSLRRR